MSEYSHPILRAGEQAGLDADKLRAAAGLYDWLDYVWPTIDEEARADACVGMVLGIAPPRLPAVLADRQLEAISRSLTAERFTASPRGRR